MNVKSIIKKIVKKQKDRFFIDFKELVETKFRKGAHYTYTADLKNKRFYIEPSDTGNTVCGRGKEGLERSVIDIRNKRALEVFKDADLLQVTIAGDKIIVEKYEEATEESLRETSTSSKVGSTVVKIIEGKARFLKKTAEVLLSKKQFKEAAGAEGQVSVFDSEFIRNVDTACHVYSSDEGKVLAFKKAIKEFPIALEILSLFSGAGLLDFAFIIEGMKVIRALEIDKYACETYRKNIGNHIIEADITKYPKSKLPKAPVVLSGSPCQGFSNANRTTNYLDNPKNLLVREFIEAVKQNELCKIFVLENVPQILTAGNGAFKKEIYNELSDFEISSGIMTASDYGSAQNRDRAIFIGSRIGKIELPKPLNEPKVTVREVFKGLNEGIPNQKDYPSSRPEVIERMKHIPQGGNIMDVPEALRTKAKFSSTYRRLKWDEQAITITNVSRAMIIHPEEHRILSIRECSRIQGVPDSFEFFGDAFAKQQQVANGVDIKIGQAIAKVIKEAVSKYNQRFNDNFALSY